MGLSKEFSDVIYPTMVIRSQTETIELQDKEIERLNNIIDELENKDDVLEEFEKWLEEQKYRNSEWNNFVNDGVRIGIPRQYILDKLNELKGDNK